jgi:hypothetical protein
MVLYPMEAINLLVWFMGWIGLIVYTNKAQSKLKLALYSNLYIQICLYIQITSGSIARK